MTTIAEKAKAKGDTAFRKGSMEEAVEHYSAAIKADPTNFKLFSNRSVCYVKLKRFKAALRDAEECVGMEPSWFKGHYRLGMANFHLGKFDMAACSYRKALELDSTNKELLKVIPSLSLWMHDRHFFKQYLADAKISQEKQLKLNWNTFKTKGQAHAGFFRTSACVVGHRIFYFGGIGESETVSTFTIFNTKTVTWEPVVEKKRPDLKRFFFHTANLVGKLIVVCRTIVGGESSCALTFNTETYEWNEPLDQDFPTRQRISHSTNLMGSCLYLFGGMSQDCENYNDFDIFDVKALRWRSAEVMGGDVPAARHSHTLTSIGEKMFLIGGTQDPDTYVEPRSLDDVHMLDTRGRKWQRLQCTGEHPPDLVHHTATAVGDSKLFVMGGRTQKKFVRLHVLDTVLAQWYTLKVDGVSPVRRIGAMTTVCGDSLYLFGGISNFRGPRTHNTDLSMVDLRAYTKILRDTETDDPRDIDELMSAFDSPKNKKKTKAKSKAKGAGQPKGGDKASVDMGAQEKENQSAGDVFDQQHDNLDEFEFPSFEQLLAQEKELAAQERQKQMEEDEARASQGTQQSGEGGGCGGKKKKKKKKKKKSANGSGKENT